MPAFYRPGGGIPPPAVSATMNGMITRRSRAREVALQLLFQRDLNPKPVPRPAVEQFLAFVHSGEAQDADERGLTPRARAPGDPAPPRPGP